MNSAVGWWWWYLVQKLQVLPTAQKNLLKWEDSPSCETVKLLPQQKQREERTEISKSQTRKDLKSLPDLDLGGNCLVAAKKENSAPTS